MPHTDNRNVPDGGWGWVVTFASLLVNFIFMGTTFMFAVFLPHFVEVFNENRFTLSWIQSFLSGFSLCVCPLASYLGERIGLRLVGMIGGVLAAIGLLLSSVVNHYVMLYISMGLILGTGLGFILLSSNVTIMFYFNKKQALAFGIANSGYGAGIFAFGQLVPFLINTYSWRGACTILAGIVLQVSVLCSLFRPLNLSNEKPKEIQQQQQPKKQKMYCGLILLRNPTISVFLFSAFLGWFCFAPSFNFIIDRAISLGLNSDQSKNLLSTMGLANCVSRIFFGCIAIIPCVDKKWIFSLSLLGMSVTNMISPWCTSYFSLLLYSILFGLSSGVFAMIKNVVLFDLVPQAFSAAMGFHLLTLSAANIFSNPLAAAIFDATANYNIVFLSFGTFNLVAFAFSLSVIQMVRLQDKKSSANILA